MMTVNEIIKSFPQVAVASAVANMKKTIQYKISSPLYIVVDNGTVSVHDGVSTTFDVALSINDNDLMALFKGELNGTVAFMTGKLKVEGDRMLAQRLPALFDVKKILS